MTAQSALATYDLDEPGTTPADLPALDLSADSARVRKGVLELAGKEDASEEGSALLLGMLRAKGWSMRELARQSGFKVSVLSDIANGKRKSGPELWTLIALADAMDFDLRLDFTPR